MADSVDIAEQFEKHIASPKQTWLLGAGVSFPSNIPLMNALTRRVLTAAKSEDSSLQEIIEFVEGDIPETSNIEDFLTHLGDLISIAGRSRSGTVNLEGKCIKKDRLFSVHRVMLRLIADTVRWGYKEALLEEDGTCTSPEEIGTAAKNIVTITEHLNFITAIFDSVRAGLEPVRSRSPVEFFTTNYDTLLEDALALNRIRYVDGFSGGGVGFWSRTNYEVTGAQAIVTKLHGSIDWYRNNGDDMHLFRIRDGDTYPRGKGGEVMIYPQATKYVNAQRDPFAELFQRFRQRLENSVDQVLLVCGYSFSDEHINAEIEMALRTPESQLTVIAFVDEPDGRMPQALDSWRKNAEWGNQVFVAGAQGLYQGNEGPVLHPDSRDWWTFSGVTHLLLHGLPDDILERAQ